jgi:SIR2-like domain
MANQLLIDPLVSLAFSMHAKKGAYALLLGSGVSRSAGIPTGWEVILDLTRKLAAAHNEDSRPDPAAWYQKKYGDAPNYAKLLHAIAKTPAERHQLLKGYFEATDEDRDQGRKTPTAAHLAIADLAASGHVRVIVTTNFDHLMEQALRAAGVNPTVISTPDQAVGAPPLIHTACTVIKPHGDYLDTRIKNTPEELAKYKPPMRRLLDRVLDEFGLIVCGWSGDWDIALRAAFERCKGRRFTTYWTAVSEPGEAATRLIELRLADVIKIESADSFFQQLAEKVSALEDLARPHPLSTAAAVATLKKYLPDPHRRIQLDDLLMQEAEKVVALMNEKHFPQTERATLEMVWNRMQRYEALSETALAMMAAGCYWGKKGHEPLWAKLLQRITSAAQDKNNHRFWSDLALYPALILLYAGGIAGIAGGRYSPLASLLNNVKARDEYGDDVLAADALTPWGIFENPGQLPELKGTISPLSNRLHQILRSPLKAYLSDDGHYDETFDRFEYFRSLICFDLDQKRGSEPRALPGRYWGPWRRNPQNRILNAVGMEFAKSDLEWPPLRDGLFDGNRERFHEVKTVHDAQVMTSRFYQ